jgi:AmiR/NasT family two-component response regulator
MLYLKRDGVVSQNKVTGSKRNQQFGRSDSVAYRKRIVVLEGNGLLAAGVRSMLADRNSLEVVGVKLGAAGAIDQVYAFQPSVIVIDKTVMAEHFDAFKIILENYYRQIRIIVLHPQKNCLEMCDKQVVTVEKLDDFLDLL